MTRHLEVWKLAGACASHPDPDLWFADDPGPAKAVCGRCVVRDVCLADALSRGEPWGVLGGLTPGERAAITGHQPRHGTRGCYAEGCRHPDCQRANRLYIAGWRQRRSWAAPVTGGGLIVPVETLLKPAGRGHGRAWPGQLYMALRGVA